MQFNNNIIRLDISQTINLAAIEMETKVAFHK